MGIQGLLPTLKSIMTPVHVRAYAGKRAAVDTYSWLHKAAYTCGRDLCEGRPTDRLIDYCMYRVNLLRHFGVQPVLVFDGGVLPMKAEQEAKRARSRKENLERAREHERLGNPSAAFECYQKAVDITPALAATLMKVLRQEGVQYVVAPYEADAQMAYLVFAELADVIITEDSDLIAYGCPRILFKMNKSGEGEEFRSEDLVRNKDLNFCNFTKNMVLEMCIMTGCDYLPSLPGMGVKKAHGLIRRFKSYQKVIRHLRFSGTTVPPQYEELFERALLTFRHQRVYDPARQEMRHLTDVPEDVPSDLEFLGPELPQKVVKAIAEGEVDPTSQLAFQPVQVIAASVTAQDVRKVSHQSWTYQSMARKSSESSAQRNLLTNYFPAESQEVKKQFKSPRTVPLADQRQTAFPATGQEDDGVKRAPAFLEEVFGTPLPDDSEDSEAEAEKEARMDLSLGWEERDRVAGKSRVLQDGRFSATEGKIFRVDEPVKLSGYFQRSRSVRRTAVDFQSRATEAEEVREGAGHNREAPKKSKLDFRVDVPESAEEAASPSFLKESPPDFEEGVSHVARISRPPAVTENRNRPSCSPPGTAARELPTTFCTNVSHMGDYAEIARKSVDRFDDTIAKFRCSKGARASGLRAPLKTVSSNGNAVRVAGKDLAANLNRFAYQPSSFKPPSVNLSRPRPRLVTTGAERSQENTPMNWS